MSKIKTPRSPEHATALLAQHAEIEGRIAGIEAKRGRGIARINNIADAAVAVLVVQLEPIAAALEAWWQAGGSALLPKGRKSLQLGGCMIGSKALAAKLEHEHENDEEAVATLQAARIGKATVRVSYALDRKAIVALIDAGGRKAEQLTELGFKVRKGEQFFVKRAEQAGTIGR
jgi:hypothetical protein